MPSVTTNTPRTFTQKVISVPILAHHITPPHHLKQRDLIDINEIAHSHIFLPSLHTRDGIISSWQKRNLRIRNRNDHRKTDVELLHGYEMRRYREFSPSPRSFSRSSPYSRSGKKQDQSDTTHGTVFPSSSVLATTSSRLYSSLLVSPHSYLSIVDSMASRYLVLFFSYSPLSLSSTSSRLVMAASSASGLRTHLFDSLMFQRHSSSSRQYSSSQRSLHLMRSSI